MTLLALLLAAAAHADPLRPFAAEYRVSVSKIPTPIKAQLSLTATDADDTYEMTLKVHSLLLKNTEISRFQWRNCQPRTETYSHEFRGFGARRHHNMTFDWHAPKVVNEDHEDIEEYAIFEDTLDELTLLLKARCAFADGETEYVATTAYGDRLREHALTIIGEEVLDSPAGRVNTLVIRKQRSNSSERQTLFWVAPEMDYMLIRAKHIENPALFGELKMRRYEGPGAATDASDASD